MGPPSAFELLELAPAARVLGVASMRPRVRRRGRSSAGAAHRGPRAARARRRRCPRGRAPDAPPPSGTPRRRRGRSADRPARSRSPGPRPPVSGWRPLGRWSSSIGNESTSVGPSPPRNRPLRSVIASSSTKISDTSASAGARSSASTRRARRSQRGRSTSRVDCSSDAKTAISSVVRPLVRVHDVLDDLVTHDVVAVELHEREVGNVDQDLAHREQARCDLAPRGGRSG